MVCVLAYLLERLLEEKLQVSFSTLTGHAWKAQPIVKIGRSDYKELIFCYIGHIGDKG
jgi:hypothetical protein